MKHIKHGLAAAVLFCTFLTVSPETGSATPPCVHPSKETLQKEAGTSDLIVEGTILKNGMLSRGTHIHVLKTYKGAVNNDTVFISGWFYESPPLFNYQKGDAFIFMLSEDADSDNYVLTNAEWSACVPSLIDIHDNDMVYDPYSRKQVPKDLYITEIITQNGEK